MPNSHSSYYNLSSVWTHLTEITPSKAKGIYIFDQENRHYIDFTSGIGVTSTGHCHPKVVEAIIEQSNKMIFGQMNIVIPQITVNLARSLNNHTPTSIDSFFFANSGAEAIEASVKLARNVSGKHNLIVFQGGFHGRTAQTMAMTTSKYIYRHNYNPLPSGIFVSPFPYAYLYGWNEEETVQFCMKQINHILHSQTSPDETAAIVIEPILGEGGYVPAPVLFLKELRELCSHEGILLIVDEVQSGFGRTGKFFAFEHSQIVPDIIVMAKGMGSGLPISCVASSRDVMDKWENGTHGGTYGGGCLISSAAALATIKIINEENLVENAAIVGDYLLSKLNELKNRYSFIGDVRGRGLMIGVEITVRNSPDMSLTKQIQKSCIDHGLLLLTCGTYGNIIRWIPPLIVNIEQINEAVKIFEDCLSHF